MSTPHFEQASDVEKGHCHGLSIDTASLSIGSPVQRASNDPLSPTFGATYSPVTLPTSLNSISNLNLGSGPSIHQLTSPTIPHLSLDGAAATTAQGLVVSSPLAVVIPTLPHTTSDSTEAPPSSDDEKKDVKVEVRPAASEEKFTEVQLKEKPEVQHVEITKPSDPAPPPIVVSNWVKFVLFFNCYRYVWLFPGHNTALLSRTFCSRFFTVVVTLNAVGIIMAALDRFPYAENNTGALILGNLCTAVLVSVTKTLACNDADISIDAQRNIW